MIQEFTNHIDDKDKEYIIFDIVIPVGPKDKKIIAKQIEHTKRNIIGYRNIYIVCDGSITLDGCITINENIFPFNLNTIAMFHGKLDQNGWYLQQLLKLYSGIVIPDILDKYLVIDSDTFFLKPTHFIENDKCLYNYGSEYHEPYFVHMQHLDRGLVKVDPHKSGITHHMMFETKYVKEIMNKIEQVHGDRFYNVFLKYVSNTYKTWSGASEYEIYFNYMLKNHRDEIILKELKWKNVGNFENVGEYDYVSYHWYLR